MSREEEDQGKLAREGERAGEGRGAAEHHRRIVACGRSPAQAGGAATDAHSLRRD